METIKLKTNINCGSCVAKVTPYLNAAPEIEHWQVDTQEVDKILTAEGAGLSAERIAAILAPSGFKVVGEVTQAKPQADPELHAGHQHHEAMAAPAPAFSVQEEDIRSSFATYKPLLLVLGYLVGGMLLREWVATNGDAAAFSPPRLMETFMGGFFIAFSFFKLLDLQGFASAYSMYDLIAARIPAWGKVYPFAELSLGVLYLSGAFPMATNIITLLLMLVGLAGVWNSLRQKRAIRCACLGTVFNLPMSTVTVIEDGGMALMAAVMLLI